MLYAAGSVQDIAVDGERLCGLTWLDGLLWYSDSVLDQIVAIDAATGRVVRRISCPGVRTDLTSIGRHLIQVVTANRLLRKIDVDSGLIAEEAHNPRSGEELCGLEVCSKGIWLGYRGTATLDLRNLHDFKLIDTIAVEDDVAGVTVIDRFVAFASFSNSLIHLLDPTSRQVVASVSVPGKPTGLTFDGRRIWYCDYSTVQLRAIELPGLSLQQPLGNGILLGEFGQSYRRH
jgi:glutamine cyclotransferase